MTRAAMTGAAEPSPESALPQDESRPAGLKSGIDPKLLEILVCPVTKSPLDYNAVAQELVSAAAKLAFPIREGIPIMLTDDARRLPD